MQCENTRLISLSKSCQFRSI